jgi:hypothetical protein
MYGVIYTVYSLNLSRYLFVHREPSPESRDEWALLISTLPGGVAKITHTPVLCQLETKWAATTETVKSTRIKTVKSTQIKTIIEKSKAVVDS